MKYYTLMAALIVNGACAMKYDPPEIDLAVSTDMRSIPDMAMRHAPDLQSVPDMTPTCGLDGQECCYHGAPKGTCDNNLFCVQCDTYSYGELTRCEQPDCGYAGKGCCWTWNPYTGKLCGEAPAYEICFQGLTCTNHICG